MAKLIHQAADKFFKQSMSRISVAKEFFAQHLPEGIYQKVNWSSLCLAKETFIDKSYKSYAADLVYQVDTTKAKKMYFYLLCEHQSKVDPWMAFRFLIYSIKVMEYHRKQYPESELPVVYPMVIYSGQAIWTATQDLFELFGEQASLARQYLTQYQVIDVCRLKDEELQQKILAGIMQ
nr:Rpn family recombination-promoting nuclease/putative transposase [Gammaproteobacteria bacterium]